MNTRWRPCATSLNWRANEGVESYMGLLFERDNGLFEYLDNPLVFCEEEEDLYAEVERAVARPQKEYDRHGARDALVPTDALIRDGQWLRERLVDCTRLQPAPVGRGDEAVQFNAHEARSYEGEIALLQREVEYFSDEEYAIICAARRRARQPSARYFCRMAGN